MTELTRNTVLVETLAFAVPFRIADLRAARHSDTWLMGEAKRMATVLATHGDDLQYGGRNCSAAFNALTRGLACAALLADGGVTFAGLHWCRDPACPGPDAPHPETHPEHARLVETLTLPDTTPPPASACRPSSATPTGQ